MKKIMSLIVMTWLIVGLVSCDQTVEKEVTTTVINEEVKDEKEKVEEEMIAATVYPLTIIDGIGREITIEEEPKAIVTLVPGMTETVFAIGKGSLVVGRTDFCDYPQEAVEIQSMGSMTEANVEVLAEVNPDIIFASTLLKAENLAKLEELGFTVVVLASHKSIDGTYKLIEDTGLILNDKSAADQVVAEMKETISAVTDKLKDAEKKSVYYVVGFGEYGDYTATGETFISQLLELAGGNNIAKEATDWSYSLEKIVEQDPEIVICSQYYDTKAGIALANGYKDLTAVKEGKLFDMDNNLLDRQGPRLGQGLLELAKIIHPEVFQ